MERTATISEAKTIMGEDFIGIDELQSIIQYFPVKIPKSLPTLNFTINQLNSCKGEYILILGISLTNEDLILNTTYLRDFFGYNADISEPCFYNQDWYIKEKFMNVSLENRWYLVRKKVFENSRAVIPEVLEKTYTFPNTILCVYTFFAYWFLKREILWENDFIWTSDFDHNSDRIYIGKYCDVDGINRNGFSIHRHLTLRRVYASIDSL